MQAVEAREAESAVRAHGGMCGIKSNQRPARKQLREQGAHLDAAEARSQAVVDPGPVGDKGVARAVEPEAIGLYRAAGYQDCPPFGDYAPDPLSLFMTKRL